MGGLKMMRETPLELYVMVWYSSLSLNMVDTN